MAILQSAQTLPRFEHDNYMLVGPAGGGKTTLACTLPGKTIAAAFDLSAFAAYQKAARATGHVDILDYVPKKKDLTPHSASDNKKGARPSTITPKSIQSSTDLSFFEFGEDITRLINVDKIQDAYDNFIIDSGTTIQEAIMEVILAKAGRPGEVPQLQDYGDQMSLFSRTCDQLFSLPMNVVLILHDEFVQDKETSRYQYQLILTGKLKGRLPNKVNHLMRCTAEGSITTGARYFLQTVPDRYSEGIRTSFEGLPPKLDVTIEDFSRIQQFGLGKIIQEAKQKLS